MASSSRYVVFALLIGVSMLALLAFRSVKSTLKPIRSDSAALVLVQPARPQANPRDEMIAQASVAVGACDPFRWPSSEQPAVISQPVDSLRLCSMLVDRDETIITISVNGDVSPGLIVGDEFRHWTVKSASDGSVTVVKDGRSRILTFAR